jgi:DNA helicase-2/ATP-dependent DNA helicase PcrA
LSGKAAKGAIGFVSIIQTLTHELEILPLSDLVKHVIDSSGLLEYHRDQDEVAGTQKVQNLEQIVNSAAEYSSGTEGLAEFLEMIALDRSRSEERGADGRDRVTLITMHNTKGLEFDRVIVTGLEEGIFPGNREDDDEEDVEEERRILYVSITRARRELYLTSCRRRRIWGRSMAFAPSRFLDEFPHDLVEVVGAPEQTPGGFQQGDQVYHDDYGTGYVAACYQRGGETVIEVGFETGRTATFLPEYTSALEKIETDW